MGAANAPDAALIPLVEEQVQITKRAVETGRVRVRTVVDTRQALVSETLERQALSVERRILDREVDAPPPIRQEGDATILSIVEERLIVTKALFLVEEVVIRRTSDTEPVEIPVTLRSTSAVVEGLDKP